MRLLRGAAFAVLGCEVFYLVVMNVFLSTPLFEKAIDATPMIVDIHYRRGWSFFPTRIHARGLSIRATDSHVEWILRFDDITFDCSLLELAQQKFHVTRARGSGITFRARMKVLPPEATPEAIEYLPPIDSLGTVAFVPNEAPSPAQWDDKQWHLWTVEIDDAIAEHVREVWIQGGRLEGDARVTGAFYLKPMRAAWVGPAHVDIRRGNASFNARTVAEPLVASIDFELKRFDPRTAGSDELFPRATLSVDAHTTVPDLDDLPLSLPASGQLSGRVEVPRLAIRIVKGILRDDTAIEAHGPSVRMTNATHVVTGGMDLRADVTHDRLSALLALDRLDADFGLAIPHLTVAVDSAALDLRDPFGDLHGSLDMPEAELAQAERIGPDLPTGSPVRISHGEMHAALQAEGWRADKRIKGTAHLRGRGLDALAENVRIRGDLDVDAAVGAFKLDTKRATDVRVEVAVSDGVASLRSAPEEALVRVLGLEGRVDAPSLTLDDPLRSVHASIAAPDVELFDREVARTALGLGPALRLTGRKARLGVAADAILDGDGGSATLDAHASALGLEYGGRSLALGLTAHARAHGAHWRSGVVSLDNARLAASKLVVSDASAPSAVTIDHFSVDAASPRFATKDPLARLQLIVALDGGRMNSTSALGDLLPPGSIVVASKAGATFDLDAAAEVVDHVARGAASLNLKGIGATAKKLRIAGDVKAVADVSRWDLANKTVAGDVSLVAGNISGGFAPTDGVTDFVVDRIDVRASSSSLDLSKPSMRGVDYGLRVGRAELVDATALNTFLPSAQILAIESGRALISADLSTAGSAHAGGGRIDVSLADGGIRLHETRLAGDFALLVNAHGFDPDRATVDIEGSGLAMRNVKVTGASTDTSAWAGDLTVESGTLGLSPPRLEAELALRARDASPIIGVLFRDSLPKFVAQLTAMPSFTALTHVAIEPENLAVSDLFASGGDIALRGTYVARGSDHDSAFVVQKGPWSIGVSLDNDGSHLRLFGLDHWYVERSRQALAPK